MKRVLRAGLSARIIGLTLLTLILAQLVGYASFLHDQDRMLQRVIVNYLSQVVPSLNRMLVHARPGEAETAVEALSNPFADYALRARPLRCPAKSEARPDYAAELAAKLGVARSAARVCIGRGLMPEEAERQALAFSVRRPDGRWLEIRAARPLDLGSWQWRAVRNILITLAIMIVAVSLISRRITRPLRDLASAAERFGRGERMAPVAERGSDEIRRSIAEFNRMQGRIERFVAERTRLVASLAHDLRTPITALRLRLEFLADDENARAMRATLDDMAEMSEATLTFMHAEASRETTRRVDLAALVDAVCEDYRAAGAAVGFEPAGQVVLACRPSAIRRALRNILDNAVAYGQRADVSLSTTLERVTIAVADRGPGIAPADREAVFDPFVRLESSRSRDTGGTGLGLAIARSVVRGHGGDITLATRDGGGLVVSIGLPLATANPHRA